MASATTPSETIAHVTGPTPLVEVRLSTSSPAIWVKLEYLNPSGSTKDRIAHYILRQAVAAGRLRAGDYVVEASSGSTSIALASACAQLGLRFIAVMPEGVSNERLLLIRAYGADIVLTDRGSGVRGSMDEAERLASERGAFLTRQFSNPLNPEAHERGTAREILDQLGADRVDAVVSGVGTGGTLVGLFRGCRALRGYAAKPVNIVQDAELECCSFSSRIPGVVDCLSGIYCPDLFPEISTIEVDDSVAIETTRQLIKLGFPVGPSSGLNFRAAEIAATQLSANASIVTVFPDRMERYFTTELFSPYRA